MCIFQILWCVMVKVEEQLKSNLRAGRQREWARDDLMAYHLMHSTSTTTHKAKVEEEKRWLPKANMAYYLKKIWLPKANMLKNVLKQVFKKAEMTWPRKGVYPWWSTDILSASIFLQGEDPKILPCGQGRIGSVKINPSLLMIAEWKIWSLKTI